MLVDGPQIFDLIRSSDARSDSGNRQAEKPRTTHAFVLSASSENNLQSVPFCIFISQLSSSQLNIVESARGYADMRGRSLARFTLRQRKRQASESGRVAAMACMARRRFA